MPTAQKENTTTENPGQRKNRAQLDHALFDVDFLHKPKIVAMRHKFGELSALAFFELICQLSRATEARIEVDTAYGVAAQFKLAPETWLNYLLERQLIESEPGFITQTRVIEDQEKLFTAREKWNAKKNKGLPPSIPQGIPPSIPQGIPPGKLPDSVNTEDLNTEDLEIKKLCTLTDVAFDAVQRWAKYRLSRGWPFDIMAAEALQMQYSGRSNALIADINASIAAQTKNIIQAPIREEKRIEIAATARAHASAKEGPPRPKPKPVGALFEPAPPPISESVLAECREKISKIGRAVPKVSV